MELYRCRKCGWTGPELEPYGYREDFGDVSTCRCPECHATVWEGMDIEDVFENVTGKEAEDGRRP